MRASDFLFGEFSGDPPRKFRYVTLVMPSWSTTAPKLWIQAFCVVGIILMGVFLLVDRYSYDPESKVEWITRMESVNGLLVFVYMCVKFVFSCMTRLVHVADEPEPRQPRSTPFLRYLQNVALAMSFLTAIMYTTNWMPQLHYYRTSRMGLLWSAFAVSLADFFICDGEFAVQHVIWPPITTAVYCVFLFIYDKSTGQSTYPTIPWASNTGSSIAGSLGIVGAALGFAVLSVVLRTIKNGCLCKAKELYGPAVAYRPPTGV